MMRRADFVAEARTYLGTPFHHQGRVPGVGLDCAGLVVCAAAAQGYPVADVHGYPRVSAGGAFLAAIRAHCDPIGTADVLPGDLMVFAFEASLHIAIVSALDPVTLLHAYAQSRKVIEIHLDAAWQARLRGAWRLKGIA